MNEHADNMIRTPKHNIPIGIPYLKADGNYYIQIKKGKKTEEVPFDFIASSVYKNAR